MLVQHFALISLQKNVFEPEFKEGINALSLTLDGFEVLSILLACTHAMIVNTWACERVVPVCASGHTLDKCYLDIQDHLPTQQGCDSASNPIEQSRLFLASIKDTILTPVNTSTLSELRGLKLDNDLPPHLKMMLLSGAITNHHLHTNFSSMFSTKHDQLFFNIYIALAM